MVLSCLEIVHFKNAEAVILVFMSFLSPVLFPVQITFTISIRIDFCPESSRISAAREKFQSVILIVFVRRFNNTCTLISLSDDSVSLTIRSFLAFLVSPLSIWGGFNVWKGRVWIDRLPHFLVKLKLEAFSPGPSLSCILSSPFWLR